MPSALRAKLEAVEAELDRLFENSGRQAEAAAEASGIFEALMQQGSPPTTTASDNGSRAASAVMGPSGVIGLPPCVGTLNDQIRQAAH